ncbi:hypothetical protein AB0K15_46465 [Amycolatopsis sp. NPDC049253]|uniref:hypothetical protein n=1 Tax=Amycolatopsis sp. NPDC049253 TaxID=3155274 RepID=UPI00343D2AA8
MAAVLATRKYAHHDQVLFALLRRAATLGNDGVTAAEIVLNAMLPAVPGITGRVIMASRTAAAASRSLLRQLQVVADLALVRNHLSPSWKPDGGAVTSRSASSNAFTRHWRENYWLSVTAARDRFGASPLSPINSSVHGCLAEITGCVVSWDDVIAKSK